MDFNARMKRINYRLATLTINEANKHETLSKSDIVNYIASINPKYRTPGLLDASIENFFKNNARKDLTFSKDAV